MHSNNFNISTYFKRINYTGPAGADTVTLHALMRHQLFSVPFENLDVQAGKVVSLAPDDIADKVLTQGRGGYCYEVNGLFAMALEALGIPYRFVAARLMRSAQNGQVVVSDSLTTAKPVASIDPALVHDSSFCS